MNIIEGVQSDWRSLTLPFFLKFIGEKALSLSLLNQFLVCTLCPQPSRLQHRARTHRRRYKCLEFKAPLKGMFRSTVLIKCQLC